MAPGMNTMLEEAFSSAQVNADFTQGILLLKDLSRISFCHRVGERWARAEVGSEEKRQPSLADQVLAAMAMFRLNAKHLEIKFNDGSTWEFLFRAGGKT